MSVLITVLLLVGNLFYVAVNFSDRRWRLLAVNAVAAIVLTAALGRLLS